MMIVVNLSSFITFCYFSESDKKVKINNNRFNYQSYIGSENELPIKTIGLREGIKNTYKIIKHGME